MRGVFITQAAALGYQEAVGWAADPNPGVKSDDGLTVYNEKAFPAGKEGMTVSGINTIDGYDWISGNCDRRVQRGSAAMAKPDTKRAKFRTSIVAFVRYAFNSFRIAKDIIPINGQNQ
ncbi:MAG: hypothetical protein WDM70_08250 [Nitrosomonadales bacterium]